MRRITSLMSVIVMKSSLIDFKRSSKWFINLDFNDIKALPHFVNVDNIHLNSNLFNLGLNARFT